MRSPILVIDLGSTKLKAAMYSQLEGLTRVCSDDSPLQADTVQADDVLASVLAIAHRCCEGAVPSSIVITGATRTHVLTGHEGQALDAVVKLDDARGAEFENQIRQAHEAYGTGQSSLGMGAFQPFARVLNFQRKRPDLYAAARWQLELKDWLNLQLTGVAATDPVSHGRMLPSGADLTAIASRLELSPSLFANVVPTATILGSVRANSSKWLARWAGVPVVQCGFDAWCASFGMGCVADGQTYNVSGTTDVFGSFRTEFRQLLGVSCLQWTPNLYHLGGPCQTGLNTLSWFGRAFLNDSNPHAVLNCAACAGDDGPLCIPFISGERMPFWRPDLCAQFLEVRSHHGLPEFARALLDGLMVFQRYVLSMLAPHAQGLYLSGGGSTLAGWAQRKADAFNLPVTASIEPEPGLLGAALCALTAMGTFVDMAKAQVALSSSGIVTAPDALATQRILAVEKRLSPHLMKIAEKTC